MEIMVFGTQKLKIINGIIPSAIVGYTGAVGNYRKVHLFYKEKLIFTPGDIGFSAYEINGVKVGMMICFDWFFRRPQEHWLLKELR